MELIDKINLLIIRAKLKFESFLYDEKGDTNFISILVILGIALALAGVFLRYKDSVLGWVNEQMSGFFKIDPSKASPPTKGLS